MQADSFAHSLLCFSNLLHSSSTDTVRLPGSCLTPASSSPCPSAAAPSVHGADQPVHVGLILNLHRYPLPTTGAIYYLYPLPVGATNPRVDHMHTHIYFIYIFAYIYTYINICIIYLNPHYIYNIYYISPRVKFHPDRTDWVKPYRPRPTTLLLRPDRHTIAWTAGARIQSSSTERVHQISFPISTCLLLPIAVVGCFAHSKFRSTMHVAFICFVGFPKTIGRKTVSGAEPDPSL